MFAKLYPNSLMKNALDDIDELLWENSSFYFYYGSN